MVDHVVAVLVLVLTQRPFECDTTSPQGVIPRIIRILIRIIAKILRITKNESDSESDMLQQRRHGLSQDGYGYMRVCTYAYYPDSACTNGNIHV